MCARVQLASRLLFPYAAPLLEEERDGLVELAKATEELTGSKIEAVLVEALYRAFDDDGEPTGLTIAEVPTDFVPLSKAMADQITGLRTWAKGRARFATSPQTERRLRKLAA